MRFRRCCRRFSRLGALTVSLRARLTRFRVSFAPRPCISPSLTSVFRCTSRARRPLQTVCRGPLLVALACCNFFDGSSSRLRSFSFVRRRQIQLRVHALFARRCMKASSPSSMTQPVRTAWSTCFARSRVVSIDTLPTIGMLPNERLSDSFRLLLLPSQSATIFLQQS